MKAEQIDEINLMQNSINMFPSKIHHPILHRYSNKKLLGNYYNLYNNSKNISLYSLDSYAQMHFFGLLYFSNVNLLFSFSELAKNGVINPLMRQYHDTK